MKKYIHQYSKSRICSGNIAVVSDLLSNLNVLEELLIPDIYGPQYIFTFVRCKFFSYIYLISNYK